MDRSDYSLICENIAAISPYVRFVGIVGERGNLIAHRRREDLEPLLDESHTAYQFSHIAIKVGP